MDTTPRHADPLNPSGRIIPDVSEQSSVSTHSKDVDFEVPSDLYNPVSSEDGKVIIFHKYGILGEKTNLLYLYESSGKLIGTIHFNNRNGDFVERIIYFKSYSLIYFPNKEYIFLWDHIILPDEHQKLIKFCPMVNNIYILKEIDNIQYLMYVDQNLEEYGRYCHIILMNLSNPSDYFTAYGNIVKNRYGYIRHFVTNFNNNGNNNILVNTDGYNVDIYNIILPDKTSDQYNVTPRLSFKLTYITDMCNESRELVDVIDGGISFIEVKDGKLYFNNLDYADFSNLDNLDNLGNIKTQFMAIDLEKIKEDGLYTPIPLYDMISSPDLEILNTKYKDQNIIDLTITNDCYILEYSEKRFVSVKRITLNIESE